MKLRVGLIGLGDAWETRHRHALRTLSDRFEVRAVCAEVARRAEQVAREFQAESVDGFRALAARDDVDAVMLLSSHWFGSLPLLAACEHGKSIYCASALEIDLEKARFMKERVDRSGVAFMAEFPRRHAPATLRLKELLATRLGRPRLLFCQRRRPIPPSNGTIRDVDRTSLELREMLELVDWCRYVVGHEPTSVFGVQQPPPGQLEFSDYEMMSLDFSPLDQPNTGPLAHISCGRYLPPAWEEAISFRGPSALQIVCERGIAFVDLPSTLIWFDDAGRHLESLESERPVGEQLLTQFHRAVTSLVRRTGDLEDAYRALLIVLTARKSWQTGQRQLIDVPE